MPDCLPPTFLLRGFVPNLAGEVGDQIYYFNGGCERQVGPPPEAPGDWPVPVEPGECGDVQLYVFS
jgi:hypothetical protein